MCAAPTWAMIESLLVAFDAFPTKEVLAAVWPDEFNHMISDSITTLAPLDCFVFRHRALVPQLSEFTLQTFQHFQFLP